jgi:hypothetical protein
MTTLLDEAVHDAGLRVAPDLLLFRKALLTLDGVLADLGAAPERVDGAVRCALLGRLAAELPCRLFAPPDSRAFAGRLSTADLLTCALDAPWAAARFWIDEAIDLLDPAGAA